MLHQLITRSIFLMLCLAVALFASGVAEANEAPTAVGTISAQIFTLGGNTLNPPALALQTAFSDPDGDTLTYSASSSDTGVATTSVSGSSLTITPVAAGTATVTVTATDPGSLTATQSISVTVIQPNRAPTAVGTIPAQPLDVGDTVDLNVESYFSDPDGDPLTYTASSSDTSIATGKMTKSVITLTAVAAGTATVTVKALDPRGLKVTQDISVTVTQPSSPPTAVGTIPAQILGKGGSAVTIDVSSYFSDADGDPLAYSAASSDVAKVKASVEVEKVTTLTPVAVGSATVTVTASDPGGLSATQTISVSVEGPPTAVGTMPDISGALNQVGGYISLTGYFSHPQGNALTYSAASSDTGVVQTAISNNTDLQVIPRRAGTATITVTATSPSGLTATQSFTVNFTETVFVGEADAVPGLSGEEQLLLGSLLTYETVIFNELHNGSDDANDWLELRNVSNIDIPIENWQLTIQTGSDTAMIPFRPGTVLPAGEVLLITNTKLTTTAVVVESFVLPQTDFALILRSPIAFGDIAGNYFQTEKERPETAPELTVDTVWERVEATTSGYRAEAWAASTHRNGLGSPGYQPPVLLGDLNHDGVLDILDLVLIASQFGTTGPSAADLNADNTVNIQDLVLIANALDNGAAAPSAGQSSAALVNNWLQLAQQNASDAVSTSLPNGFSYARGIQMLEQLVAALTPDTTALLANYPNPFNPETWIPYQLSKAADVAVTIYASDGNVVRTLALGLQDAGMYTNRSQAAYWNGKNELGETVASGVYFYTLTAGEFAATRKMLILK